MVRYLAEYYLTKLSRKFNKQGLVLPEETIEAMENYNWKGNVRELKNIMTNAIVRADDNQKIGLDIIPSKDLKLSALTKDGPYLVRVISPSTQFVSINKTFSYL